MIALENRSLTYLPGVGPARAELLRKELGLQSYEDLLHFFPFRYIDRSRYFTIAELRDEMPSVQLKGHITSLETLGVGAKRRLIAHFQDATGNMDLIWFKGIKYITQQLHSNKEYIIFGKPTRFGRNFSIVHPEIDPIEAEKKIAGILMPYYHTSEKMKRSFLNSKAMRDLMYNLFNSLKEPLPETLPENIVNHFNFLSYAQAMRQIHFPQSSEMVSKARLRLKFEELFYIQLNLIKKAVLRKRKLCGLPFIRVGDYFNTFYKEYLPFELTGAQKRVIKEIRADVGQNRQMNRLLQGDVGSGKTLVGLLAMLLALDNKYQACLMAPTEILANQHYVTLKEFLGDMDIEIALLTGSTKKRERKKILPRLAEGKIQIIIGTHALLEDTVVFSSLGLAIIDEQHRFGVAQRSRLWTKNEENPPHILVMTATPIPRTLAMTLYGDLEVSVIDELPPGRKPVKTIHRYDNRKKELFDFLRQQINAGRQVYVVYPLIKGNEKLDYKDLEEGFATFQEVFKEYTVCMVHGRMKPAEKDTEMQKFISGKAQILMATTVIEVGVNVPNASVMVIESAERFGLSQLHQLRGRVGRGAEQSYCILVTSYKLNDVTRKRLDIMVTSNNGFEIAEADLRLRGHGDLEGTQQSGEALDLKIANLSTDGQLLSLARDQAETLLEKDPNLRLPEHQRLVQRLRTLFQRDINWGLIS